MGGAARAQRRKRPGDRRVNTALAAFLALGEQDRRDVLEAAASRLDTLPGYTEKDLWVCVALDAIFNGLPDGHPRLLFKGGTSLSKVFGLIDRFSEDIDLVIHRDDLGFGGDRDPTAAEAMSKRQRAEMLKRLTNECSSYVLGDFRAALTDSLSEISQECRVVPGADDTQALLIEYPTLYPVGGTDYVTPSVKIEAGARSALGPSQVGGVTALIDDELHDSSLDVAGIRVLAPQRTYWEKLLILHGTHCGYRDEQRLPEDRNRISRHYYDVAMITATETGAQALSDLELLDAVRNHNLVAFRQAWKRFEQAAPGSLRLVPQSRLREAIERDYAAMQDMILGDAPDFEWINEKLREAEDIING